MGGEEGKVESERRPCGGTGGVWSSRREGRLGRKERREAGLLICRSPWT